MTPDLGQGGGQALEDAVVLAASLANPAGVSDGLAKYDAQRRSRTRSIVKLARQVGSFAQADGVLGSLRMGLMRVIPQRLSLGRIEQIAHWNPPSLG